MQLCMQVHTETNEHPPEVHPTKTLKPGSRTVGSAQPSEVVSYADSWALAVLFTLSETVSIEVTFHKAQRTNLYFLFGEKVLKGLGTLNIALLDNEGLEPQG